MKKTVDQYIALDAEIKALEKKRSAIREKLLDSRDVGTFIPGSNGAGVLITEATRSTIDSKALKAELPDLAARFSRVSTSVSLRISDNHQRVAA
jgi:hypothetical protein